jgi:TRAP-type transport system small permease protein
LKKLINGIANLYTYAALIGFFGLIGILTVEIISRYIFDYSFVWSQEFASILICWITFLGFGKVIVDREDINITYFIRKFSKEKMRKVAAIINSILLFVTSIVMLIYSFRLTVENIDKTTLIMRTSSALYYVPLVLLMILVVLYSIYQLILILKSQLDLFAEEEVE